MHTDTFSPAVYQSLLFVEAVAIGFSIGVCLDFYRALTSIIKFSRWITILADLFFWAIVSIVSLAVLLVVSWGEIYFYSYLGIISGFLIYYILCSRFVFRFWTAIIRIIKRAVTFLFRTCRKVTRIFAFILAPLAKLLLSFRNLVGEWGKPKDGSI